MPLSSTRMNEVQSFQVNLPFCFQLNGVFGGNISPWHANETFELSNKFKVGCLVSDSSLSM